MRVGELRKLAMRVCRDWRAKPPMGRIISVCKSSGIGQLLSKVCDVPKVKTAHAASERKGTMLSNNCYDKAERRRVRRGEQNTTGCTSTAAAAWAFSALGRRDCSSYFTNQPWLWTHFSPHEVSRWWCREARAGSITTLYVVELERDSHFQIFRIRLVLSWQSEVCSTCAYASWAKKKRR